MINRVKTYFSSSAFVTLVLSLFTITFSCFVTLSMSNLAYPLFTLFVVLVTVALLIVGRRYWWLIFPVFAFMGSYIDVGFKIFPGEIGVLFSCIAIILSIQFDKLPVLRKNSNLTSSLIVLVVFIILHMFVSIISGPDGILVGGGSIARIYLESLTWLIFSYFLFAYGSARQIRIIFTASLFVLLVRNISSAILFFLNINNLTAESSVLVLPPLVELRYSALLSILVSIIVYYISENRLVKTSIVLYVLALVALVMLGQGRVSSAIAFLIVLLWIVLTKNIKLILSLFIPSFIIIIFILINSSLLSYLPFEMQRAISFIPALRTSNPLIADVATNISLSDDWHNDLLRLGFEKWTNSFANVAFGNRVDSTDVLFFDTSNYDRALEIAVGMARYESTLWTVLATFGLFGLYFYVKIFWYLLKDIVPIVLKEGITCYSNAVYGVTFISVLMMVVFIWIRGSFPGFELLFCVMAKIIYDDSQLQKCNIPSERP